MHKLLLAVAGSAGLAATATAQSDKTLLFVSRYDSTSLDTTAGLLGEVGPFDITGVTPGSQATAFPWLPAAGISATIGDPDNNGVWAGFSGLPQASFGLAGLFVKHADRRSNDVRKVFWTVRVPITTPPKIDVFSKATVHTVRPGDFVRLADNGEIEFFMRQEHFVKAAGPQSGNWVDGAGSLCQAPNGDLFYSPPNAPSKNGGVAGGHWVNKPLKLWCNDGAIVRIPAGSITYDANGNVADVAASSAIKECGEVGAGPQGQASVRDMVLNSGALDSTGKRTTITFTMIGLEIDPNGGTWTSWEGNKLPNLIFTFNNTATTCCNGPWGSWRGTIFSTAPSAVNTLGSVARINGVSMGTTTGTASGAWLGVRAGTGDANAPVVRGLAWLELGLKPVAPYGNATLQVENEGVLALGKATRIALQARMANFPLLLAIDTGIGKGSRPSSIPANLLGFGGFGGLYVTPPFLVLLNLGTNANGQAVLTRTLPNDPNLKGINLLMQGVSVGLNGAHLTNPVITEFR